MNLRDRFDSPISRPVVMPVGTTLYLSFGHGVIGSLRAQQAEDV